MSVTADNLRPVELFAGLSDEELTTLAGHFERKDVRAGSRLVMEGASGYTFFVIENGTARVEKDGVLLNRLGPGDFFGETAIVSNARRNATVTAETLVDVFVLFGTEFRLLESELPGVAEKIQATIAERNARIAAL